MIRFLDETFFEVWLYMTLPKKSLLFVGKSIDTSSVIGLISNLPCFCGYNNVFFQVT